MEFYIKKRIRHFWDRFKWLVLLYIFFWIVWIVIKWNTEYFDQLFQHTFHFKPDFFDAWFSGLSEDLFFFGTGFLGLVLSTKLLKDETFDIRISALTNGKNISKAGEIEITKGIKALLSYNTYYQTTMEIESIDQSNQYIFVHVDMKSTVANVCEDEQIPVSLKTFVEPGPKIQDTYGTVYYHVVSPNVPNGYVAKNGQQIPAPQFIIKKGHNVQLNGLGGRPYTYDQDYYILPDGEALYELSFGVWVPINQDKLDKKNNWFFNSLAAFTENFSFSVLNKLNRTVKYNYLYPNRLTNNTQIIVRENQELLSNAGVDLVVNIPLHKGDKFEIYFFL